MVDEIKTFAAIAERHGYEFHVHFAEQGAMQRVQDKVGRISGVKFFIVIGADQIAAGINGIQNGGQSSMSVVEYGGYSAACTF
jgi:tetrahydromethanopterin S-methyltransferase subunit G